MAGLPPLPGYTYVRELASGGNATTYLYLDTATHEEVAVKLLPRRVRPDVAARVWREHEREILIHRRLDHPHIIRFHRVLLTDSHLAIVMEYLRGEDLWGHLFSPRAMAGATTGLAEPVARYMFQQIIVALHYLHRAGCAHRDLKLENVIYDDTQLHANVAPVIKLCDFGASKNMHASAPRSEVGTYAYMPPEVLHNARGLEYDGAKADVWSAGVLLYVLLFRVHAFVDQSQRLKMDAYMAGQWSVPRGMPVPSEGCLLMLREMLQVDPAQRISVPEILSRPWFQADLQDWVKAAIDRPVYQEGAPMPGVQSEAEIMALLAEAPLPLMTDAIAVDLAEGLDMSDGLA